MEILVKIEFTDNDGFIDTDKTKFMIFPCESGKDDRQFYIDFASEEYPNYDFISVYDRVMFQKNKGD